MPTTTEVWIRVVGALVGAIGTYYVQIARTNQPEFIRLTVFVRFSNLIWFAIFVFAGWAPPTLILFGLVDAAGAAWTFFALKKG